MCGLNTNHTGIRRYICILVIHIYIYGAKCASDKVLIYYQTFITDLVTQKRGIWMRLWNSLRCSNAYVNHCGDLRAKDKSWIKIILELVLSEYGDFKPSFERLCELIRWYIIERASWIVWFLVNPLVTNWVWFVRNITYLSIFGWIAVSECGGDDNQQGFVFDGWDVVVSHAVDLLDKTLLMYKHRHIYF